MRKTSLVVAALVLGGALWPTPALAQECGGLLSGWFGPKCIEANHYWWENYIAIAVTWSETSAKDDDGRIITTVRLMITNHSKTQAVQITNYTLGLHNDEDLQLTQYSRAVNVVVAPEETERVDFQFPVLPGLVSDAESISPRMAFRTCDKNGENCLNR